VLIALSVQEPAAHDRPRSPPNFHEDPGQSRLVSAVKELLDAPRNTDLTHTLVRSRVRCPARR
jgi:hypothetical protein